VLGQRQAVPISGLVEAITETLEGVQRSLFAAAKRMLDEHTEDVTDYERLKERVAANAGFSRAFWCGNAECEARVKAETRATIRCIPFDQPERIGPCLVCGEAGRYQVIWARAY
jgi:prolyl-tRNA synthetase